MSAESFIIKSDKPLTAAAPGKTVPGGFGQFPSRVRTLGYWRAMRGESRDVYPVLVDLARAENNFTFCASRQQIADDIGCSTKRVQRGIGDLVSLGLVEVIEEGRVKSGKATPGAYRLLYPSKHATEVVSGHRCPEDTRVSRHLRPEVSGHRCPDPVDTGVHPSPEKRSTESSRAEVAAAPLAAPLAAPQEEAEKAEHIEQVELLTRAGMQPSQARQLPERNVVYLRGMIERMKRGDFEMGGLYASIRDGDWSIKTGVVEKEVVWSVSSEMKRVWGSLSDERRSEGLRKAFVRFGKSPEATKHVDDVIAGKQQPREWLIDDVVKLTRQEVP